MGASRHTMNKADACPGHAIRAPMEKYSSWICDSLRYVKPPPRAPAIAARMALMSSNHHLNVGFIFTHYRLKVAGQFLSQHYPNCTSVRRK